MPRVKADAGLCEGHANCIVEAGEVFDLDDEGLVVVLKETITEAEREDVERAVQACPVSALSLLED
ncbi:MAG TPA: ferredoxin [Mycobacteriales bacterium]|jgi:3-phenylpropionate/trans-cinnamate dioxygenase ferredoxin reductase subunit|nr:ferredoxin [Mycobacteriales bacterium]